MPKKSNVTDEELSVYVSTIEDVASDPNDIVRRMEQGYHDPVGNLEERIRIVNNAIRTLSEMNAILLFKLGMETDRRETTAALKASLTA